MRVKFKIGQQRKFIQKVLIEIGCPSLRRLKERGIPENYQTLKSYYAENRTLPEDFFLILCTLAKIDFRKEKVVYLKDSWGQRLGGKS